MPTDDSLLDAAEKVVKILRRENLETVVIGAVALAAHRYIRHTRDLDLGVNADIETMRRLVSQLKSKGFNGVFHEPDGQDPLGGVIDISGSFGLIQLISFADRFPAVIHDAIQASTDVIRPGSPLLLTPLPHLVALKLYAGGLKSKADIVELLQRNPEADVREIHDLCDRYRLCGLDEILREFSR